MIRTIWICDSCGKQREITDRESEDESCTCWDLLPGWMTIEKFKNGRPERIEICAECAEKLHL